MADVMIALLCAACFVSGLFFGAIACAMEAQEELRRLRGFAEYVRDCGIRGQDDTVMRQRAIEALRGHPPNG